MTTTQEALAERLKAEIERQCGIGAGSFYVDAGYGQSGLWEVNADLDPAGLAAALITPPINGITHAGLCPESGEQ